MSFLSDTHAAHEASPEMANQFEAVSVMQSIAYMQATACATEGSSSSPDTEMSRAGEWL